MLKQFFGDTKPKNYDYLTFKIIFTTANKGKVKMLQVLEKLLLKTMVNPPPAEVRASMDFVHIFSGKNQTNVISTWLMEFNQKRKMASILMKFTSVKFN